LGNDVQLHFHPQWDSAKFENGEWSLSDRWAIASYSQDEIGGFIKSGKEYLESLILPIKNDYSCIAFRAGAYYIEPSENVLEALKANGFACDTSITKGMESHGYFDFKNAESNIIPWHCRHDDIKRKSSSKDGILELPIYSFKGYSSELIKKFFPNLYYPLFHGEIIDSNSLNWFKIRDRIKNKRYPPEKRLYKKNIKKGFAWYAKAILSNKYTQLDYDYLPATIFVDRLGKILKDNNLRDMDMPFIPIIASGHVKDMHNTDNIRGILELIKKNMASEIEYWTITDAVNYWKEINI
jgi:hypothetical protein